MDKAAENRKEYILKYADNMYRYSEASNTN